MAEPLLVDTDVLMAYLRGREAIEYPEGLAADLNIFGISVAELSVGLKGD